MKTALVGRYVLAVLTALALSTVPVHADDEHEEADHAAIDTLWANYAAAAKAGDIDAWLSLWTEDGVQMPPNEPSVFGAEQLRERNGAALAMFAVDMRISNEETQVMGDWAYSRGTYVGTFTPKDGGAAIPVDGKFLTIFKRQSDGGWKIHRDAFNSNVSPGAQ
ncbi:MAG: SgcJ/EcaC family oxidoreductase [Pseudomonadota bacterium]